MTWKPSLLLYWVLINSCCLVSLMPELELTVNNRMESKVHMALKNVTAMAYCCWNMLWIWPGHHHHSNDQNARELPECIHVHITGTWLCHSEGEWPTQSKADLISLDQRLESLSFKHTYAYADWTGLKTMLNLASPGITWCFHTHTPRLVWWQRCRNPSTP